MIILLIYHHIVPVFISQPVGKNTAIVIMLDIISWKTMHTICVNLKTRVMRPVPCQIRTEWRVFR